MDSLVIKNKCQLTPYVANRNSNLVLWFFRHQGSVMWTI